MDTTPKAVWFDENPIAIKVVSFQTRRGYDNGTEYIYLDAIAQATYRHPDAKEIANITVFDTFNIDKALPLSQKASTLVLLEANEKAVAYAFREVIEKLEKSVEKNTPVNVGHGDELIT